MIEWKPAEDGRWSMLLLLPLAVVGPPVLAACLVLFLPYPPADRGNSLGLALFPCISAALLIIGAVRSHPGVGHWILLLVGGVTTVITFLSFAVGMMAP